MDQYSTQLFTVNKIGMRERASCAPLPHHTVTVSGFQCLKLTWGSNSYLTDKPVSGESQKRITSTCCGCLRVVLSLYVLHPFRDCDPSLSVEGPCYFVHRIPDPALSNYLSTQVACIDYTGLIVPIQVHNVHNAVYVSLKAGPNHQ